MPLRLIPESTKMTTLTATKHVASPEQSRQQPAVQNHAGDANASPALPLSFSNIGRTFTDRDAHHTVLRNISYEIAPGEIVALLGASGCGKSTLLRIAAGLDAPTTGQVRIGSDPVTGISSRAAVAFQESRLLPWRTIAANVALGLPLGTPKHEGAARVAHLLEVVGLSDFAKHRPREISGGMAQRASLARALAREPGVLLLDEPFGALDALTRLRMQDLVVDIHEQSPTTVLLVTHDVDEALQLADRVVVLGRNESDLPGATIKRDVSVPTPRPRDRASTELAPLRGELLAELGVSNRDGR